jgi:hypothetical protein
MITEDYVSFGIAKLLKEKGFDENCDRSYVGDDAEELSWSQGFNNSYYKEFYKDISICSAPRISFVMKWLREVHNQIIVPGIRVDDQTSGIINCYIVGIWYIPKNNGGAFCYTSPTPYNGYPSYEEACEAAIKYCLENLI